MISIKNGLIICQTAILINIFLYSKKTLNKYKYNLTLTLRSVINYIHGKNNIFDY